VLAILLPVGIGAGLSYRQVELSLVEQSHDRSFDAARFHGTVILDRLILAERGLQRGVTRALAGQGAGQSLAFASDVQYFDALGAPAARVGQLAADDYPAALPLPADTQQRTALYVSPSGGDIFLAGRPLPQTRDDAGFQARIDSGPLFGREVDQVLNAQLCMLERGTFIYCTSELVDEQRAIQAALRSPLEKGRLRWTRADGSEIFASSRELFMPSHFEGQSWTVVVAETDATVFAPISVFRWLFPGLTLLVVCILLFLVVNQTRRQLGPISKLQRHAERVGAGDFDTRLELHTDNEFEQLADSFNGMAERLGDQFQFLEAMSEIDAALLSSADVSRLCATILRGVLELLPVHSAAIYSVGRERGSVHTLYSYSDTSADECEVLELDAEDRLVQAVLLADGNASDAIPLEQEARLAGLLPGDGELVAYPFQFEGKPFGALCLRIDPTVAAEAVMQERIQAIRDRLTVALSALERQYALYVQAHYDHLTGLPNRMLFLDRLDQYFAQARRQHKRVAVVYADLDKFKLINDTLGHKFGDEVLKEAAGRFAPLIRGSDTVARLSGDEFALALPAVVSDNDVDRVLKDVIREFAAPFSVAGQEFHLNVSMGVALYPDDGGTAEEVLKRADIAMYRAKSNPGCAYMFYEERMNQELQERSRLAQELKQALRDGGLSLAFQPKVDATTHRIESAEALIRWQHPERGWMSPGLFIPVAEEAGLIPEIGEFALQAACEQCAQWQREGLSINQVAVNVSPRQIQYTDLVSVVEQTLARTQLPPHCLELEITEDLLIEDYEKTEAVLSQLKALGVGLALDDFGTGYSSLGHLHELSFDTLKIDKCFVDNIGTSDSSDAIVNSIVALGKTLNKKLVAEGVENLDQLRFLADTGCELIQGYYFSKPLSPEELSQLLALDCALPYSEPAIRSHG
jgi:diguanylate cyclase (GGDEF)-like protein